jgi:hypothetical protein
MAQPRHHTPRSPDRPTRGAALAQVAQVKARPLMPWQRRAGDVALELDVVSRHYAFGIVIVSVPRQAGKTKLESDVADHRCLTLPGARCWITMQNGKTVDSWMREEHFASLARATPFGVAGRPSARYDQVRRAGEVGVRWRHGSTFYTFPPKRDALHSKQSDLAMVDEAWAHDAQTGADIRQAIRPTMATRRGAQLWIVSTMGDDASVFFDDYVEMGRAAVGNPHSRVCFVDYGIGDDVDPEDLQAIADAHPAYGHTINMQTLVDAREDFGKDVAGWARAYGNRATRTRESAFSSGVWTTAGRPRIDVPERAGISLDATPSGDRAALAAGWRADLAREPGEPVESHGFVELLFAGRPSRDLPDVIVRACRRRGSPLIVDRAAVGALEIVDAVARLDPTLEVRYLTMAEAAGGCVTFYRGVLDDTVHHFNDPDLTASAEVAIKRDAGDGAFLWRRKGSTGSVAELIAATNALKGYDQLPAPARRAVARAGRRA